MRYNYLQSNYFLLISVEGGGIYRCKTATAFFYEVNARNKGLHSKSKTDSESQTERKEKQQSDLKRGFPSRILQKRRVFCAPFIHRSLAIFWCPFWTPSCLLDARPSTNIIICRSFVRLRWTYRTPLGPHAQVFRKISHPVSALYNKRFHENLGI